MSVIQIIAGYIVIIGGLGVLLYSVLWIYERLLTYVLRITGVHKEIFDFIRHKYRKNSYRVRRQ